jgi:Asp-tRNA(Asn)/Glu-tRNA(Gln) amidotransferase A subunit family amidase
LRKPQPETPRAGVWEQFYEVPVDAEIQAAVRRAAALLADFGIPVEPFAPRGLERAPNVWAFLFNQWPSAALCELVKGREDEIHWTLRESLGVADPSGHQVFTQLATRDRMRATFLRQMQDIAVLIMPVCGITAFHHRQRRYPVEDGEIGLFQAMMPAVLANVLGLPAVTVPMAVSQAGMPIGIQMMGRPFEEELLLELAVRLEEARGPLPFDPSEPVS